MYTVSSSGITLKEALDIAYDESDNELSAIYIEPPDSNILTDEDSGDEDDGGLVDNLSRRQLCVNAEIVFPNQTRIGGLAEDNNGEVGAVEFMPQPSTSTASVSSAAVNISTRPKHLVFCETGDLTPSLYGFLPGDYSRFATLSCVELFELFFTNKLLETIAAHTKSYALFKNCPDPNTYLTKYKNPPKSSGRVSTAAASTSRVSDDLRYDGLLHYIYVPENKRRRCAGIDCKSRGRTMCSKCDVGLCIECFRIFHTK
ncbi:hypothetical protein MML48_6g00004129 [Holotrichia oblita]|uniref:Uncharacterized protein n=1 Tax=Holotrichia oblita TaxID=644536 RepID=A0ACB9SY98_HOLOL|nr:hypothetical protein MML48_6g00004129 [Holotrichia oblita]